MSNLERPPAEEMQEETEFYEYELTQFKVQGLPVEVKYDPDQHRALIRSDRLAHGDSHEETIQEELGLQYEAEEYGFATAHSQEIYLEEDSGITLVGGDGKPVKTLLEPANQ